MPRGPKAWPQPSQMPNPLTLSLGPTTARRSPPGWAEVLGGNLTPFRVRSTGSTRICIPPFPPKVFSERAALLTIVLTIYLLHVFLIFAFIIICKRDQVLPDRRSRLCLPCICHTRAATSSYSQTGLHRPGDTRGTAHSSYIHIYLVGLPFVCVEAREIRELAPPCHETQYRIRTLTS